MAVALEELRIATSADPSYALDLQPVRAGLHGTAREPAGAERISSARCAWRRPTRTSTTITAGSCARPGARTSRSSTSCRRCAIRSTRRRGARIPRPASARCARTTRRRPRNSSSARCGWSPTIRPRCCSWARSATAQGNLEEARKLVGALQQAGRADGGVAVARRCASSASSATASRKRSYANQLRRRFAASREYQLLQRGEYD